MGKSDTRREWIVRQLRENGSIQLSDIVEAHAISEATARRDLEQLEQEKKCIRTFGGAIIESTKTELPFFGKLDLYAKEKKEVADKAVSLIRDGDIIGLTGGTTNYYIAKRLDHFANLTVVTNAINIAFELVGMTGIQIIVTGGVIRSQSYELSGPLADGTLERINIQKAFIGVDGVSLSRGLTTFNELEAQTNRLMMQQSLETYIVADHTKFNQSALFAIGQLSDVNGIFTDSSVPTEIVQLYRESGVLFL